MKTAHTIESQKASHPESGSVSKPKRGRHPNSLRNLVAPWTSETAPRQGNSTNHIGGQIARQVLENNREEIYKGMAAKAMAGDAYAFNVLAEHAMGGKLKQTQQIQGPEGGAVPVSIEVRFRTSDGR
jgi:hypothetical protein